VETLQAHLAESDLEALDADDRDQFIRRLRALRHRPAEHTDFSLSLSHGTFSFGTGLLEALRGCDPAPQGRFAWLLVIHELFHDLQGIRTTNYFEVGRAGVVLEMIDFTADVIALRVATRCASRRLVAMDVSVDAIQREIVDWFDAVLFGIEVFDRWQHGVRISALADRRLRRYLTWHLQRARGATIESPNDVESLLGMPMTVELAPLTARLDLRFDREVIEALPSTELFAAAGGALLRHPRCPGFDPSILVEAVRTFDTATIRRAMDYIIGEHRTLLVPWRA
jgi:hypothetical protein